MTGAPRSLAGGSPGRMPADDLVGGWGANLLWEVWGRYTHTLERTPEGWRCSGMALEVTHARGNERARDHRPDA